MLRELSARGLRRIGRFLLWLLVVLVLLALPLAGLLGSETGSRWLLERGLSMQQALAADVRGGTLLTGMHLANFRLHTRKSDLFIRNVLARWSLLHLLRGEIVIEQLQADDLVLTLTAPPSRDPVKLPVLILPVALDIHNLVIHNVRLQKHGREWPVAIIRAKGRWSGASVRVDHLEAHEPRYGDLVLAGRIRLLGGYPLQASGQLSPKWLAEKSWGPLQVRLSGEVANLGVEAESHGRYRASLTGTVQSLLHDIPYQATLDWSDLSFPWLSRFELRSQKGHLRVIGDRQGLRSEGNMQLLTHYTPTGLYRWQFMTDWSSIYFNSLKVNGLGGEVNANGRISWLPLFAWDLRADLSRIDLAKHWPVSRSVLPVLDGSMGFQGSNQATRSQFKGELSLAGGEHWSVSDEARGILWAPQTVHRAKVEWASVKRPVPGVRSIESDAGHLSFEGNRSTYSGEFFAGMTSPLFPKGVWSGLLTGHDRQLLVEEVSYRGDAGALQGGAELDLSNGVAWQGAVVLDGFQSGWAMPDWSGQFYGSLSGKGEWGRRGRSVDLTDIRVSGSLRDHALKLDGPLRVGFPAGRWPQASTTGFKASWGDNHVAVSGGLEDVWKATLDLDLADPSLLQPQLRGRFSGQLRLDGSERSPDVHADIKAVRPAFADYMADAVQLRADIPALGSKSGNFSLSVSGMSNKAGLTLGNLSVQATGSVSEHQLTLEADGAPVSMKGVVHGQYAPDSARWSGLLQQGEFAVGSLKWMLAGTGVPLTWNSSIRTVEIDPHCWSSAPASLCVPEKLLVGPSGRASLVLTELQADRLASFMPEGLSWRGAIEGNAQAEWLQGQSPIAQARFVTRAGDLELARDEGEPLVLRYDQLSLLLDADQAAVRSRLELASADLGQGHLDAIINPYAEGRPVTGEVALSGLRLELLQPFLPALSVVTGKVSGQGRLDGVLAKPQFWGDVRLTDGRMSLRNAPLVLDDMNIQANVQGDKADFSGQLKSGEGGVALSGKSEWSDQLKMQLDLKGDRFAVRQEPQLLAEVSPDLHLQLIPGQLDIKGAIRVPYARINLKKLPERTVSLSSDVQVRETADGQLRATTVRKGQAIAVNADVEIALGDDVFFNGFGVIGGLNGGVRLRQSSQRGLEANGEVGLAKEARYEAYGQKLKVRRGQLVFAGNITQPAIDAEAIREIDDKVVGIRVQGRANAPEATLFSEPTMPQEEMLSYLVLGRSLASRQPGAGNDAMLAAAAIKLGAHGGEGLTTGIGNIIGVRDLSLDAEGKGDDTQVKVSGYLSPDLYLSYGVGVFTPVNSVTMRYQVRPRLYLEAVSSIENAIDLFYNFRF